MQFLKFLRFQNRIKLPEPMEPRVLAKTAGIGTAGTTKNAEIGTAKTAKTAGIGTAGTAGTAKTAGIGTSGIANEKSWNRPCLITNFNLLT